MKKKLNTQVIANELRTGSAFFRHVREQTDTPPPPAGDAIPLLPVAEDQLASDEKQGTTETWERGDTDTRKQGTVDARKPGSPEVRESAAPEIAPSFHLGRVAHLKYTLAFREEELDALEDVKLALRRQYDVRASKTDIVRLGLHELIQDFYRNKAGSVLVERLKELDTDE